MPPNCPSQFDKNFVRKCGPGHGILAEECQQLGCCPVDISDSTVTCSLPLPTGW